MLDQKNDKNKATFLKIYDNKIGPGHYDPNRDYVLKNSTSAVISAAKGRDPAYKGLENLVNEDGNMANRLTMARGQINDYLGSTHDYNTQTPNNAKIKNALQNSRSV